MAINKNDKVFEQFNREALFKKLQEEMQKRNTPQTPDYSPPQAPMLRFPQTIEPLQPELRPHNPPEPLMPEKLPYIPEKPKFVMPQLPDNWDGSWGVLKIPDTTHDDGFYITPEPKFPTKPNLAPQLPDNLPNDIDPSITERFPWLKEPFDSTGILQKKPEIPQAEVDETRNIMIDWFGENTLSEGFAKKLVEIMSATEHSPFETSAIKVDTGNEIVRDWFADEPEKLVKYLKTQSDDVLYRVANGSDINNQQTTKLVRFADDFDGMHESQAGSAGTWDGYGNGWTDYEGGLTQNTAKSPFSEETNLNYGDSGSQTLHQLQKVLFENGFYGSDMPTSGVFDDNTLKAVIRFQLMSNMSWSDLFDSNGKYKGVDAETLKNLQFLYLSSTEANKNARRSKNGAMISCGGLYGDPLENMTIIDGYIFKGATMYDGVNVNTADKQTQQDYIWHVLTNEWGWTPEQAAGLMGNLEAESDFSSFNKQNKINSNTVDADYEYDAHDSVGYGLVQWTYYSRKEALQDFANSRGTSVGDLQTQLEFIKYEMNKNNYYNDYSMLWNQITDMSDIDSITKLIFDIYEGPDDSSLGIRQSKARKIYEHYIN